MLCQIMIFIVEKAISMSPINKLMHMLFFSPLPSSQQAIQSLFEVCKFFIRTHVNDVCFKLIVKGDKLNCLKIIRIKMSKPN